MKHFLNSLRDVAIAGFFFLLPVFVVFIIVTKAWASLTSVGTKVAGVFGMKAIMGLGPASISTGILMIGMCIACGLLVRFSFVAGLNKAVERGLSKYVPAYDTYKSMAEEKLRNSVKVIPYTSALIKQHDYWQPAYVIEHDRDGNYVVFVPLTPETNTGHVLLATANQVKVMPSLTANQLDASLKKMGVGLLSEYSICTQ